jgi:protein phosphatase
MELNTLDVGPATALADDEATAHRPGAAEALAVTAHGQTDPGLKRPNNEDQFLIAELGSALRVRETSLRQASVRLGRPRGWLLVVADGVGGMAGGAAASALAVGVVEQVVLDTINWCVRVQGGDAPPAPFERALAAADGRVRCEGRRRPELHGMGTTLTLAYIDQREAFIAHVGDSRCYLLRSGVLNRLTRDHTLVEELVLRGVLRPDQAARHNLRNVIVNVVGGNEDGVKAEVHRVPLRPGDRLLLCSDGLTEMVPDDEIQSILNVACDPDHASRRLVERANENGGRDNITVVVAQFDEA